MTISPNLPDPTTAPPWYGREYAPDTGQTANWLANTSDVNRRWWIERARRNADEAQACWMQDHQEQIDTLKGQLAKARERIAWLERNYGDPL